MVIPGSSSAIAAAAIHGRSLPLLLLLVFKHHTDVNVALARVVANVHCCSRRCCSARD